MPKLKIYKKVKKLNFETEQYYFNIEPDEITSQNFPITIDRGIIDIFWRSKIWDIAIFRSMEIWKKIPSKKMENSIGKLTQNGKRSLSGKIGLANNKYFVKDDDKNWIQIKTRNLKNERAFFPLSEYANQKCKERTKKKS